MSRGTLFGLRAGARKGFVLLWAAVLLCSLLLQYVVTAPPAIAADSGAQAPGAFVTPAPSGTTPWTNQGNVLANDDVYATASVDNIDSFYREFGFGVPGGSIITGITAVTNAFTSDTDGGCQISMRLSWNDGASWTSRKTVNINATATATQTFGSTSDTWGRVWDPTQVTNGNFRAEVRNEDASGSGCNGTTSLDWLTVAVSYTTINHAQVPNPVPTGDVCDAADFNFAIDMSGSIGPQGGAPSNLGQLKEGITGFVTAFESQGSGRYSGTRFNVGGTASITGGAYTNATAFNQAVNALANPTGLTPTAAGIAAAAGNNGNDRPNVPNVLFVVTDGSPNRPNTHGDDTGNPDTWLQAANAAIAAADDARAGSGASRYTVEAIYLSTDGDPGDTGLPFSAAGDRQWANRVMDEIGVDKDGNGNHWDADFTAFIADLFASIGCEPPALTIDKTADAAVVDAGDEIGFTITIHNAGGKVAHDVVLDDDLPDTADTDWAIDAANSSNGCSITGAPGNQALHCEFASIADGADKVVHVVSDTVAACGTLDNTASFTSADAGGGSDSASVRVRCASIDIEKEADAASVTAGDPIGFRITVTSNGPAPAKGVTVTDTLPTDPGLSWSIDGGNGADDCEIVAGVLSCDFGTLNDGASRVVHITSPTTQATLATSPVANTARVDTTNDGDDEDTDEVDILAGSIDIEKAADAESVPAGEPIGFLITVTSTGPGAAKGVTVTDTLPTDAGLSWSIDGGTADEDCAIAAGQLTCDFGDLPNGDVRTVHISSPTTRDTVATSPVTNTARVDTTNDGSDEDTDDVDVLPLPDVAVTKSADNSPISAGEAASFTILVENIGDGTAQDVTLTDDLPGDIAWTVDDDACEIVDGTLTCEFGDILPGDDRSVTVSGETTAAECGDLVNTASVAATNEPDDVLENNSDSATVVVSCPQIVITKTTVTPEVSAGDDISFDIEVTNTGAGAAFGVHVTDTLPVVDGVAWSIDDENTTGNWTIDAGVLEFGPAALATGASAKVRIVSHTTAESCQTIPNLASLTYNGGTGSDDSELVVLCAQIAIEKDADDEVVIAGDAIGFTITVSNTGDGSAYDVIASDTLDPAFDWTLDPSAGWSLDDNTLSFAAEELGAGETTSAHVSAPTTAEDCRLIVNTATAEAADDGSDRASADVEVRCASIDLVKTAGAAADGTELVIDDLGDVIFSYRITNTGTTDLVDVVLVDDNATPGNTADDVTVTCPATSLAPGASITCYATLPVDEYGVRTNWATVTAFPELDLQVAALAAAGSVSDTDDAVVRVPEPVVTPTPRITPPPTSTLDTDVQGGTGNGLLLVLLSLAGIMLALGYLVPKPAGARRRNHQG